MSDLVGRLLAAISEKEAKARAADSRPWWDDGFYVQAGDESDVARFGGKAQAVHVAANGPLDVLRLCQAHREIVKIHKPDPHDGCCNVCALSTQPVRDGIGLGCDTMRVLARGYSVTEESGDEIDG